MPTATTAADNELIADNPDDKDTARDIDDPAKVSITLLTDDRIHSGFCNDILPLY